jgi:hypothetical protein
MLRGILVILLVFTFLSSLSVFLMVRAAPQSRTLVLTGHPGELPVVEIGGRSYVDVEALTRLANGSLSTKGNQIVLTLPSPGASTPATNLETGQSGASGFSKDFLKAGIEGMEVIREWRSTLKNAIEQGFPVTENWVDNYRARAEQSLRLVSLAVSTDYDRNAVELLTNEFRNMRKLSDRFVGASKGRVYVSPRSFDDDPLDQKILKCARSLAAMVANNQFVDDGSCH